MSVGLMGSPPEQIALLVSVLDGAERQNRRLRAMLQQQIAMLQMLRNENRARRVGLLHDMQCIFVSSLYAGIIVGWLIHRYVD